MVQQPDVHQREGLLQAGGARPIRCRGLGIARRVVVEGHHGRGIEQEGPADDLPRGDLGAVDGAVEEVLASQDAMARVQEQAPENFPVGMPTWARR